MAMRAFRGIAVGLLLALTASAATAQSTRHFRNSWFWGAKGGAMLYQVQSVNGTAFAPTAGIDWLITRTHGGLYVAYDYAFFNEQVLVNDSVGPTAFTPTGRPVTLKDMHRWTMLGMLFPMPSRALQPYLGLGFELAYIPTAEPQGAYSNRLQQDLVLNTISTFRASASPHMMLGLQWRLPMVSVFAQANATSAQQNFFLYTGSRFRTMIEGGVRYNIGSSIDPMR